MRKRELPPAGTRQEDTRARRAKVLYADFAQARGRRRRRGRSAERREATPHLETLLPAPSERARADRVEHARARWETLRAYGAERAHAQRPSERTPSSRPGDQSQTFLVQGRESAAHRARTLGLLVSDGVCRTAIANIERFAEARGVKVELIAAASPGIRTSDDATVYVDRTIEETMALSFDALALLVSEVDAQRLADHPGARLLVADADAQQKLLGRTSEAARLLHAAGVVASSACLLLDPADPQTLSGLARACITPVPAAGPSLPPSAP